jgi:DNA-binding XRE family transcriptional regulator
VANSTNKYLTIDLKNPTKGLEKIEKKVQARARLRVKNLRLKNNKTQKDVANYLGIDLFTYNKYEKGNRKLSN